MENTSIQGVLGFENGVDMEHIKKYLEKMWIKRKNYLDALWDVSTALPHQYGGRSFAMSP